MTDKEILSYIQMQYRPLSPEMAALRQDAEAARVPVIARETEALLLNLIRISRPEKILEIGTGVGYSSACFAFAAPQAHITTLELMESRYRQAKANLARLNLTRRVTVLAGDARETLKALSGPFDFVFIDAAKSWYDAFFELAAGRCRDGALILCDNVLLSGRTASDRFVQKHREMTSTRRMRTWVSWLLDQENIDTALLPVGDGVTFSILHRKEPADPAAERKSFPGGF